MKDLMTQAKICMLGAYAVGKTSLVARFVRGIFSEQYLVTLGVKIDTKEVNVAGQTVKFILWDMAGEDEFAKVNISYLKGAAGYFLVADGTRRSSVDQAAVLQVRVTEACGFIPFITLINKSDLEPDWEVLESDLEELRASKSEVFKTSAKTGEGVEQAFTRLGQRVLEHGLVKD
jgi:small GTP-binding protein